MKAALPLILLGAGGHAKVLLALAHAAGREVAGVCAPDLALDPGARWRGIAVLGGDEVLVGLDPAAFEVLNGIGQVGGATLRARLFERFCLLNFRFPAMVHPHAWVAADAQLASGVQIMAGAVVQPDAWIGANSIINTGASVDHDCRIGRDVHVAPGAVLCGNVQLGEGVFIGSGATVIQGVTLGAGAVVGAGTVVLRNLPPGGRLLGAKAQLRAPG